jgi:hypothetical protein
MNPANALSGTLVALAFANGVLAQPMGHHTVPNVQTAFNDISTMYEPLLANRGTVGMSGPICKHYQGIARYDHPVDGTPYLFVARSGNATGSCPFASDEPGAIEVIRLGSRPADGERLGSNVDKRDAAQFDTPIPTEDRVAYSMRFTGNSEPAWMHMGGMQIIDDVMVVAAENRWPDGCDCGALLFYDIRAPERPELLHSIPTGIAIFGGGTLGLVGITKDLATGRYLMVVTAGDSRRLRFYETTATSLFAPDLGLDTLFETQIDTWDVDGVIADPSVRDSWQAWQTLNFVRQSDGRLFLIGMQRTTPLVGTNLIHLYEVIDINGEIELLNRGGKELQRAELAAAGGVHVSPSGELILYSTLHNEGLSDSLTEPGGDNEILIHEWRSSILRLQTGGVEPRSEYWAEIVQSNRKVLLESADFNKENWESLRAELLSDPGAQLPHTAIFSVPAGRSMVFYPFANYVGPPTILTGFGVPMVLDLTDRFDLSMSIFAGRMQVPDQLDISPFIAALNGLAASGAYQGPLEAQFFGSRNRAPTPLNSTTPGRDILLVPTPGQRTLLVPDP